MRIAPAVESAAATLGALPEDKQQRALETIDHGKEDEVRGPGAETRVGEAGFDRHLSAAELNAWRSFRKSTSMDAVAAPLLSCKWMLRVAPGA